MAEFSWPACGYDGLRFQSVEHDLRTGWKACHDVRRLYIGVVSASGGAKGATFAGSEIQIFVEAERTKPWIVFFISPGRVVRCRDGILNQAWQGPKPGCPWQVSQLIDHGRWSVVLTIPCAG